MKFFLLPIVLFLLLVSCVKDKPQLQPVHAVTIKSGKRVFVINEGGFGYGNAGISAMSRDSSNIVEDLYHSVNHEALGDVAQSMTQINGQYYMVVNNSGKVVFCDGDFKKKGEIKGMLSPRYMLQVSPRKAYVSDFKSNKIYIVDLGLNTISGFISCNGWTEGMVSLYGKAYVSNKRTPYTYVIDVASDKIEDSILVGASAGSILVDNGDNIWVLAQGDQQTNVQASLSKINPLTNEVTKTIYLPGLSPFGLCSNVRADSLYFVSGHVYRFVPGGGDDMTVVVSGANENFYGMGVDPLTSEIYVSDALDYSQRSIISIYDIKGNKKKSMKAGVNASSFYFE